MTNANTKHLSNQSQYLLAMKDFVASATSADFFASDLNEIGLYACIINSLATVHRSAQFDQLFSADDILEYHKKAYGHLHKSRKSYNWHQIRNQQLSQNQTIEHCTVRSRKLLINCAQKMYDMLTSNRIRNHQGEADVEIITDADCLRTFKSLARTLDSLVDIGIIHGKIGEDHDIIEAKTCISYLYNTR